MATKRLVILFFIFISNLFPCDYWINGLQQNYLNGSVSSIRLDTRYQLMDGLLRGSSAVKESQNYKASHLTTYLTYNYNFNPIGISITFPFTKKNQENIFTIDPSGYLHFHHGDRSNLAGEYNLTDNFIEKYNASGIGDIVFLTRYTIFSESGENNYNFNLQAGSTIPTGSIDSKDKFGYLLHPHLQNGTGTSILLFSLNGFLSDNLRSLSGNIMIGQPMKSKNIFQEATGVSYNVLYRHQIQTNFIPINNFLTANIGFLGKNSGVEKYNGKDLTDSGGNYIFGILGTSLFFLENLMFEVNGQFSIYKNLKGTQLNEKFRIQTAFQYFL